MGLDATIYLKALNVLFITHTRIPLKWEYLHLVNVKNPDFKSNAEHSKFQCEIRLIKFSTCDMHLQTQAETGYSCYTSTSATPTAEETDTRQWWVPEETGRRLQTGDPPRRSGTAQGTRSYRTDGKSRDNVGSGTSKGRTFGKRRREQPRNRATQRRGKYISATMYPHTIIQVLYFLLVRAEML
jgi:hypothetical protein